MNRPSPYVRRKWLGREIRRLREEHDVTSESIARALGFPRQQISALENGHLGPDQGGCKFRGCVAGRVVTGWGV
ncbi:helix-turn-helix transcriptional regulator [Micromonospora sp. CNB394]|uniref:helix-turn-helix transcriptional regulator n=1 Tax=Micromonospora sp. CNB394 TaxID=1169151 RepID=UPI001E2B8AB2|nr:helix-turn-helix transcriptional regulator [Micromonospora sp. CNB394]